MCIIVWTKSTHTARTLVSPVKERHKQVTSRDAPMQSISLSSSDSHGLYAVCAVEGCKQLSASRKGAVPTNGFVHLEPRTFVVYRCLGISSTLHSNLHSFASCFVVFELLGSCRATWATINRPVSCWPRPRQHFPIRCQPMNRRCSVAVCTTFGGRSRVVVQGLTERCCTLALQLLLRATV